MVSEEQHNFEVDLYSKMIHSLIFQGIIHMVPLKDSVGSLIKVLHLYHFLLSLIQGIQWFSSIISTFSVSTFLPPVLDNIEI